MPDTELEADHSLPSGALHWVGGGSSQTHNDTKYGVDLMGKSIIEESKKAKGQRTCWCRQVWEPQVGGRQVGEGGQLEARRLWVHRSRECGGHEIREVGRTRGRQMA